MKGRSLSFFLTSCNYAFPSHPALDDSCGHPCFPWWPGPGLSGNPLIATHMYGFEANPLLHGLAPAYTCAAGTLPLDGSFLSNQATVNQDWSDGINNPSMQDQFMRHPFRTAIAAGLNGYDELNAAANVSSLGFLGFPEQDGQNQPDFQLTMPAPEVAMQTITAAPVAMEQILNSGDAFVQKTLDGRFRCSEGRCNKTCRRAGDCRRHLKKHNRGPFFSCTQRGCDMEFYRHDKLRDHLKQGHDIIVAAPARGRRPRRTAH
ncbi:hypothetical protein M3J09_010600 [Ascochyta lentis]